MMKKKFCVKWTRSNLIAARGLTAEDAARILVEITSSSGYGEAVIEEEE